MSPTGKNKKVHFLGLVESDSGEDDSIAHGYLERINSFRALEVGWDSYEAPPPSALAIDSSLRIAEALISSGLDDFEVDPSTVGGIGFSFFRAEREVYIEVLNDGAVAVAYLDEEFDIDPKIDYPRTEEAEFSSLPEQISQFLHG